MNWEKLKENHFFKEPVPYVYASTLVDTKYYEHLYENQNNLTHQVWQDFDKKYKTGFQFYEDISDMDLKKDLICCWFFKERNDRSGGEYIMLSGKKITYFPNTFFITKSKDIKILTDQKRQYIRRPFIQLDLKESVWEDILKRFDKLS